MFSLRAALISLASLSLVAAVPAEKRQDASPHEGRASFYEVGLGVCGVANQPSDFIVALSPGVFDTFPSICGRHATVTYKEKTIIVEILDRCASCALYDIDLSFGAFEALAGDIDDDLIEVTWEIIGV